jgi:hypothetical protein
MDKTALVSVDLERGSEMLRALDQAKIKVNLALWAHLAEYEDWRFVVSGRKFDSLRLTEAYGLLNGALTSFGIPIEKTPPVLILPMSDPFVRSLRRFFGKTKSVEGMRLGGQLLGDRFLEDGYVYRIS